MPACPRCRAALPMPPPPRCGSCGEGLASSLGMAPIPLNNPVGPPGGGAAAGAATPGGVASGMVPAGTLKGPRLAGRLADGRFGEFPLAVKTTLGRHPANTLRLVDREVSKEHASIERIGNTFLLRDLGSSNGTFVNGRRVRELRLRDGDEIALGNSRLVFQSGDNQSSTSPGVTVVASAQSMPAFLAQIEHAAEEKEFRPADQHNDLQALRTDYEKLRIANEFHRMVGMERDQKSLMDKILKVAFQLLPADNGVVFLPGEEGELIPAAVSHRKGNDSEVVVSDTVLKRVTETRQAVLTADAILDSRFSSSESIVAQGIRSAMAVPLLAKGSLKGVLFCDTRERTNAFSEKDLKVLAGIASQAAVALENADLAQKIREEELTRAELSRFLSPAVAEAVVSGQLELFRNGRMAEVSVLFADIRGFTSMAESESPPETVVMLNTFFTAMADIVFSYQGNLDKFIGDCVMAVWGPPSSHPDDASRSLRAALDMQAKVDELNAQRAAEGQKALQVGIGINTGPAVVGYVGSPHRREFTAIGDSVNVASRLCGLAKGGEIICTEGTLEKAGPGFETQQLSVEKVKGKEKGVPTFRVTGYSE